MWRGDPRWLSQDALERRASGRRHHNRVQQLRATFRRGQVAGLLASGVSTRGTIAAQLGVHPSTISRDIAALLRTQIDPCPTCGRPFASPRWAALGS